MSALLPTFVDIDVLVGLFDRFTGLVPHIWHYFAFTINHLQSVLFLYAVPLHYAFALYVVRGLVIFKEIESSILKESFFVVVPKRRSFKRISSFGALLTLNVKPFSLIIRDLLSFQINRNWFSSIIIITIITWFRLLFQSFFGSFGQTYFVLFLSFLVQFLGVLKSLILKIDYFLVMDFLLNVLNLAVFVLYFLPFTSH